MSYNEMGYGGHPAAGQPAGQAYFGSQGQPPAISPEVEQWFRTVDRDNSGKITSKELQSALVNGQGKHFSDAVCQLMIGMFDSDKTGTIGINEFSLLYNYINQWLSTFRAYDRDNSGSIEESELSQAFQQMGFHFSPEFVKFVIKRSDLESHQRISVDQFISISVQIQRFTEAFRTRDKDLSGVITIGFEDFLSVALSCSV